MERERVIRFELKQLIKERGLTQEEFGKLCSPELDRFQVSKLTKASNITFDMLERIVNALELDSEEVGKLIAVYKKESK